MLISTRTLVAVLLVLCISRSWAQESQREFSKQRSVEAANLAAQKDAEAAQAATALLEASEARHKAATDASAKEAEATKAVAEARDTSIPDKRKIELATTQRELARLQDEFDLANGLFIITAGKKERGEPITRDELSAAEAARKSAEAKLKAEQAAVEAAETRAQSAAQLHLAALARAEAAKAAAVEAKNRQKTAEEDEMKAATAYLAAQAAAVKADTDARLAAFELSKAPPPKSNLPSTAKQQALDALLDLYRADKIDPAAYHEQRAKIIAEPDVK